MKLKEKSYFEKSMRLKEILTPNDGEHQNYQ